MLGDPKDHDANWSERWPEFVAKVSNRLRDGHARYGDWSFGKPPSRLFQDIEEELLDVCAWSYILYCRLTAIRRDLDDLLAQAAQLVKGEVDEERS